MDFFHDAANNIPCICSLLVLLLSTHRQLQLWTEQHSNGDDDVDVVALSDMLGSSTAPAEIVTHAALHSWCLWNCRGVLDGDLGYWVKPRSTTWFSRFLLDQYDNHRWVKMFRFSKKSVFSLAELLRPSIQRHDTKYRLSIPSVVRVACTLFKLAHGASLLICSEMFAVGRSSVSLLLRDVVHAINIVMRSEISWPRGDCLLEIEHSFNLLCGLSGVVGCIDGTHVAISKPKFGLVDYYYFKLGGYTLNCQAVVDSDNKFLDLFLGMPGSTNDSRVLRRSSLYNKGLHNHLWNERIQFQGFTPYLLSDSGYPLLPWLMVPHRGHGNSNLLVADALFNERLRRGRGVVENAFALLKQSFRELLLKSDLHVTFIPDVIVCCAILHNFMLRQSHADMECLLNVLRTEEFSSDPLPHNSVPSDDFDSHIDEADLGQASLKRRDLGMYLAIQ